MHARESTQKIHGRHLPCEAARPIQWTTVTYTTTRYLPTGVLGQTGQSFKLGLMVASKQSERGSSSRGRAAQPKQNPVRSWWCVIIQIQTHVCILLVSYSKIVDLLPPNITSPRRPRINPILHCVGAHVPQQHAQTYIPRHCNLPTHCT